MHQIFLSLGSNLNNRKANLEEAIRLLINDKDQIIKASCVYETEPWGCSDQQNFYNQVVELSSRLSPMELLDYIHDIEAKLGRKAAGERYQPRTMDIDILFYEHIILTTDSLMIPHPLIHLRRFVLIPMVEICPKFIHPVLGRNMIELLNRCDDKPSVVKL